MSGDQPFDRSLAEHLTPANASDLLGALLSPEEEGGVDPTLPRFPGYAVLGELGRGGAGRVYLASREGSEALVALKHLEHHHSPNDAQRAWRELEMLAQLRAPCLPRVLDYGHHEGRIFIVTEYIEGLSLTAHCRAKNLDRRGRVALLAEVAGAVQTLHNHGIIHRDIKPSNIIINIHGKPIIIDLGIAILLAHDVMQTLTAEGAPLGSPAFMPPEQARGERGKISIRSDVYSLGATAYLLLTGQTPHDCDTTIHEAVRRVAQEPARSPRLLDPTLPRPLEAVLSKATASEPDKRYTTANDFGQDLRRWLDREPVLARTPTPWMRLAGWIRKHPLYTTAALCALFVLGTVAATALSLHYLNNTPHSIIVSEDRSSVRLLARSGNTLYEWDSRAAKGVLVAHIFRDPSSRAKRVAIGFSGHGAVHPGYLCLFDADRPAEPTWSSAAIEPLVSAPELFGDFSARSIYFRTAKVVNVYEDRPGEEILAIYRHSPFSPSCLRIHDTEGNVLAEMWHRGHLFDVGYDPESRVLVITGVNSEANWSRRGAKDTEFSPSQVHPIIAFGLHRDQLRKGAWVHPEGADGAVRPLWYQALLPPISSNIFLSRVWVRTQIAETPGAQHYGSIRLRLQASEHESAIDWPVSPTGEFSTPVISDTYRVLSLREDSGVPDGGIFYWADLPPIVDSVESR